MQTDDVTNGVNYFYFLQFIVILLIQKVCLLWCLDEFSIISFLDVLAFASRFSITYKSTPWKSIASDMNATPGKKEGRSAWLLIIWTTPDKKVTAKNNYSIGAKGRLSRLSV